MKKQILTALIMITVFEVSEVSRAESIQLGQAVPLQENLKVEMKDQLAVVGYLPKSQKFDIMLNLNPNKSTAKIYLKEEKDIDGSIVYTPAELNLPLPCDQEQPRSYKYYDNESVDYVVEFVLCRDQLPKNSIFNEALLEPRALLEIIVINKLEDRRDHSVIISGQKLSEPNGNWFFGITSAVNWPQADVSLFYHEVNGRRIPTPIPLWNIKLESMSVE